MSTNFHVYLATKSLPSPSKWQAEITKMNSSLIMDTDINLVTFSGFLPFQFNQEVTGFEYCSWFIDHEEKQEVNIPSADFCMCFSIGNNPLELTITESAAQRSAIITQLPPEAISSKYSQ